MKRIIGMILVLMLTAACGGSDEGSDGGPGDPATGRAVYNSCLPCHGLSGEGVEGLGTSLATSQRVRDMSDADLVAYIEMGSAADAPDNVTGMPMPAKGGNMRLKKRDLVDVVAYLRTLNP